MALFFLTIIETEATLVNGHVSVQFEVYNGNANQQIFLREPSRMLGYEVIPVIVHSGYMYRLV